MEQKKIPFFKKLKNAIVNFDEYQNFSQEKLGTAIKYFLKLMLIFSILISGFLTARMYKEIETIKTSFAEECPDFRIENNTLLIEGENKKYEKDIGYETLGLIVDSENTDLTEEQNGQYQRIIAFYKDRMVMKTMDTKTSMTYEDISKNQNINGLSKQQILDYANSNEMLVIYSIFFVVTIIFVFIAYSIQILLDIFLLSIIGLIMSKIAAVKLKYKEVFNMMEPLYKEIVSKVDMEKFIVMGDSAGGGLALALEEKLSQEEIEMPEKTILISPWLDTRLTNPKIPEVQKRDRQLNKFKLQIAALGYAGKDGKDNYLVNPIDGDLSKLKNTTIFTGTNDILNPDVYVLKEKAEKSNIEINIKEYENAGHIWFIEKNSGEVLTNKGYQDCLETIKNQAE